MYIYIYIWLVVLNMTFLTFQILEMSSSQLTFIFFRGVETINQIYIYLYYSPLISQLPLIMTYVYRYIYTHYLKKKKPTEIGDAFFGPTPICSN